MGYFSNFLPPINMGMTIEQYEQEVMEKFITEKENIMKNNFTTEELEKLRTLIAPKDMKEFEKIMGVEKSIFRKEDFITGDKVILRNGITYIVIRDCNAGIHKYQTFVLLQCAILGEFMNSDEYEDELCDKDGESEFDVMKIYRNRYCAITRNSLSTDLCDYSLIWSRE